LALDPGIDFTDFVLELAQSVLFDDRSNAVAARANDASVTKWLWHFSRQHSHGGFLCKMKITQVLDGAGKEQRHITGKHQNVLVSLHLFAGALNGVSGAALICLQDKLHAHGRHHRAHGFRLMADHNVDVSGRRDLQRRGNYVRQQRPAADFVKNLGAFGFEPRAFAGRHDDNGEGLAGSHVLLRHEEIILTLAGPRLRFRFVHHAQ
jgi:hypothetical protein